MIHYHFAPYSFLPLKFLFYIKAKKLISLSHFLCVRVSKRHINSKQAAPWSSLTAEGLWTWHLSICQTIPAARNIQDQTGSDLNQLCFIQKLRFFFFNWGFYHIPSCISCAPLPHLAASSFLNLVSSFLIFLFFIHSNLSFSSFTSCNLFLISQSLIFQVPLCFYCNAESVSII